MQARHHRVRNRTFKSRVAVQFLQCFVPFSQAAFHLLHLDAPPSPPITPCPGFPAPSVGTSAGPALACSASLLGWTHIPATEFLQNTFSTVQNTRQLLDNVQSQLQIVHCREQGMVFNCLWVALCHAYPPPRTRSTTLLSTRQPAAFNATSASLCAHCMSSYTGRPFMQKQQGPDALEAANVRPSTAESALQVW